MSWQHDPITDLDLMAYADGQLDAARRATVEAHLATAPEDAAMVEAIMAQNEALRRTLMPIAREAVPERLKAVLEHDRQPAWRPLLQTAAMLALVAASGLGGWWLGREGTDVAHGPPAYLAGLAGDVASMPVGEAAPVAEAVVADEVIEAAQPWFADRVALELSAPGLGDGFSRPDLQRLVEIDGRPTVRFELAGPEGRQLALYLQTRRSVEQRDLRVVEADSTAHAAPTAYWQDGPMVWALTGDAEPAELVALAERIALAIELQPRLGPADGAHTDRQPPDGGTVQLTADEGEIVPATLPAIPALQLLPVELAGG
jgi:anti-sigma factor RsiW